MQQAVRPLPLEQISMNVDLLEIAIQRRAASEAEISFHRESIADQDRRLGEDTGMTPEPPSSQKVDARIEGRSCSTKSVIATGRPLYWPLPCSLLQGEPRVRQCSGNVPRRRRQSAT